MTFCGRSPRGSGLNSCSPVYTTTNVSRRRRRAVGLPPRQRIGRAWDLAHRPIPSREDEVPSTTSLVTTSYGSAPSRKARRLERWRTAKTTAARVHNEVTGGKRSRNHLSIEDLSGRDYRGRL